MDPFRSNLGMQKIADIRSDSGLWPTSVRVQNSDPVSDIAWAWTKTLKYGFGFTP